MWLSQVGALPAKDPVQAAAVCALVQRLHQHLVEHVLRLQDMPELWEFGVDLESDSAGSSPGWQQGPNPLCPQQSCAPGRVGCRV